MSVPRVRNASGFTLVELLVVVCIVSILMALLLPTLSKVLAQARQVSCLSREKQLYTAQILYSNDWGGAITPLVNNNPPKSCWRNLLVPYLSVRVPNTTWQRTGMLTWVAYIAAPDKHGPELIICPCDPAATDLSITSKEHSYFQNDWLGWNSGSVTSLGSKPHTHVQSFQQIACPTQVIMWTERRYGSFVGGSSGTSGLGLWHFGGTNAIYVDGHGKLTLPESIYLWSDSKYWKACPLSVHPDSSLIIF